MKECNCGGNCQNCNCNKDKKEEGNTKPDLKKRVEMDLMK